MTTVGARLRPEWLSYWLLPRADRCAVRRIAATCRAAGDPQLDALAAARLRRAARRERWRRSTHRATGAPDPQLCLARLASTMRHPSRTCAPPS